MKLGFILIFMVSIPRGFGTGRNHRDRDHGLVLDIVYRDHGLVLDIDREPRSSSRY